MSDFIIENSLNNSYLIGEVADESKNTLFTSRMISENRIPGCLQLNIRNIDGKQQYVYDITDKKPLSERYNNRSIDYFECRSILSGLKEILRNLNEYLLESSCLLIDPEYIFFDSSLKNIEFVIYPFLEANTEEAINSFLEFLLMKIDHEDERLVSLAYQTYAKVLEGDISFSEINLANESANYKKSLAGDMTGDGYNDGSADCFDYYNKGDEEGHIINLSPYLIISSLLLIILLGFTLYIEIYRPKMFRRLINNGAIIVLIALTGATVVFIFIAQLMKKYHT